MPRWTPRPSKCADLEQFICYQAGVGSTVLLPWARHTRVCSLAVRLLTRRPDLLIEVSTCRQQTKRLPCLVGARCECDVQEEAASVTPKGAETFAVPIEPESCRVVKDPNNRSAGASLRGPLDVRRKQASHRHVVVREQTVSAFEVSLGRHLLRKTRGRSSLDATDHLPNARRQPRIGVTQVRELVNQAAVRAPVHATL